VAAKTERTAVEGGLVGYGGGGRDTRLPAPPTQARGAEKRERIYRAAIARFRAAGVAESRVEEVIADAGVSWATFFRYFPRKEDVLVEAAARHFRDRIVPIAERGVADRRLRVRTSVERVFAAMLKPAELTPRLHTEALLEVFAHPARFAAMVGHDRPAPLIVLIAELLSEGQGRGEVAAGIDAGVAALTVVAGAMFPAVQAAAAGADPGPSVGLALDTIWAGLSPR
jgi:AcrR family transcriptional regulator